MSPDRLGWLDDVTDTSRRQNNRKCDCRLVWTVHATCPRDSIKINQSEKVILVPTRPREFCFKMASEGDGSGTEAWNVTATRILIQFYKDNRLLWNKKHKDYGSKSSMASSWKMVWKTPFPSLRNSHCLAHDFLSTVGELENLHLTSSSTRTAFFPWQSIFIFA